MRRRATQDRFVFGLLSDKRSEEAFIRKQERAPPGKGAPALVFGGGETGLRILILSENAQRLVPQNPELPVDRVLAAEEA